MERAKIDGPINLYRLRHSFVTLSILSGADLKSVSRAAGHSSVAFTMDTYQHVLPSMRKDAAGKKGEPNGNSDGFAYTGVGQWIDACPHAKKWNTEAAQKALKETHRVAALQPFGNHQGYETVPFVY